jgi:hypothetical protein
MLTLNMAISGTICWAHRLAAEPADPEIRAGSGDRAALLRGAHSSSRNLSLMKHAIRPSVTAAHIESRKSGRQVQRAGGALLALKRLQVAVAGDLATQLCSVAAPRAPPEGNRRDAAS